jgi:hypothetical protein
MGMVFATVFTDESITQILAPTFITVAEALCSMPANIDVIITIRKIANIIPTSKAANLLLSFTNSLNAIFSIPFIACPLSGTCPAFVRGKKI